MASLLVVQKSQELGLKSKHLGMFESRFYGAWSFCDLGKLNLKMEYKILNVKLSMKMKVCHINNYTNKFVL